MVMIEQFRKHCRQRHQFIVVLTWRRLATAAAATGVGHSLGSSDSSVSRGLYSSDWRCSLQEDGDHVTDDR